MKAIPKVQKYMTFVPKSIGYDQTIASASEILRKLHIRHLPVLKDGKIVGILSDRDIKFVLGFKDVDPAKVMVEDACTLDPYCTTPDAPLNEVLAEMAEKKYGCALVMDNAKLVGIFTEVDAFKAFSEVLVARSHA